MVVLVECRSLNFEYPNHHLALKDIDLTIEEGRKIALLGPNGAGKSTLFLHFNGVLRPKSGTVLFQGRPLVYRNKELSALRSEVAVILQNPDDQIFSATVEEDVAFGPLNLGMSRPEVQNVVDEALAVVDLQHLRERPSQQLSFGQRKRLAIAGALAMRPRLLIMDEPTAGLDPRMVNDVIELTEELHLKGISLLMSTHDIEIAYAWADEFKVLHQGRLVYSGSPEDLFANDGMMASLGFTPPTVFIMNRELARSGIISMQPIPKNLMELRLKVALAKGQPMGRMMVQSIQGQDEISIESVHGRIAAGSVVGYYGSTAKKTLISMMPQGVSLPSLQGCLERMIDGREVILYSDKELIPSLRRYINSLGGGSIIRLPIAFDASIQRPYFPGMS